MEREINHTKLYYAPPKIDLEQIVSIENWFKTDYLVRLAKVQRDLFLKLPLQETRFDIEKEAYEKEQEWRKLKGLEPLPPIKISEFI